MEIRQIGGILKRVVTRVNRVGKFNISFRALNTKIAFN
jgi:hypothetical protein